MVVSTFGLINRGKGLEYAIEAMRDVVKRHPEALYSSSVKRTRSCAAMKAKSIAKSCKNSCAETDCEYNVRLIDKYLDFDELVSLSQATDIYLTPYLNPVQIVSGTLAYAVGCGKAIVSTPYLYAEELLAYGRGFLVRIPRRALDRRTRSTRCSTTRSCAAHRAPSLSLRAPDDLAARRA